MKSLQNPFRKARRGERTFNDDHRAMIVEAHVDTEYVRVEQRSRSFMHSINRWIERTTMSARFAPTIYNW